MRLILSLTPYNTVAHMTKFAYVLSEIPQKKS
ncbi:hypothetical protein THF1C08_160051 [Vibrio jasicida]|uniref:Uncharacterized protein n=1 Tax=Vibrio jasicida TaxID=766224 RepID=A0AAU9QGJ7_9VIBR|nr:hypothetical protein THF1C08_160051 [Vibrio jasicida]CAH1576623.1 hypothetical protein THF1A12_140051 [Vibrio jasicida]